MQLSRAFRDCLARDFQAVVDVVCVSARLSGRTIEPAKFTVGVANVRWIQMAVNIEVRGATVPPASLEIGEFAECGKIAGGVKCDAVVKGESFSSGDARRDVVKFFVV